MENSIKMDDFGVPLFLETAISLDVDRRHAPEIATVA